MTQKRKGSDRRSAATAAIMAFVMVVSVVAGGAAAANAQPADLNSDSFEAASGSVSESKNVSFAYVDGSSSKVSVMFEDQTTAETNVSAELVGKVADIDDDGALEVPYVTQNQELGIVQAEADASGTVLVENASYANSHIAVGDWNGDGTQRIFYTETSTNGYVSAVDANGNAELVIDNESTDGVAGIGDFSGDGETEIVYVDTNQQIDYYNGSTVRTTGAQVGKNNGLGVGSLADFGNDGELEVPIIDSAGEVELVNASGVDQTLTTSSQQKAPTAGADWNGDGEFEVLHSNNGNGHSTNLSGTTTTITDSNGDNVNLKVNAGIARGNSDPGFKIDNFSVTNTSGQNVTVSFESSEQLDSIDSTLEDPSGTETALSYSEFNESTGNTLAYRYEYVHNGSTDGTYNGTLNSVKSSTRTSERSLDLTDSATVNVEGPTVLQVNATSNVSDGDELTVEAEVEATADISSVEADSPVFDNAVSLSGDGTYTGSGTVNATGVSDGQKTVTVTATDADGKTDTDQTTFTLDTTAPTVNASGDTNATAGESVSLTANATDATSGVNSVQWEFGDGGTATGADVSHTYDSAGEYTATVTVTDAAGNENTDTVTVDVTAADDGSDDTSDADDSTDSDDSGDSGSGIPADVRERDNADVGADGVAELPGSDVQRIEFEEAPAGRQVVVDRVSDLPENAAELDGVAAVYRIDVPDEASDSAATIEFSLDQGDLDGADASAVVVEHYDGEEWTELDTSASVDDGEVTVEAETGGFSTFAVTTDGSADDTSGSDDTSDSDDSTDDTSDSEDTSDDTSGSDDTTEETTDADDSTDDGSDADESTDADAEETTATEDDTPGFGAVVALVAVLASAFLARRR